MDLFTISRLNDVWKGAVLTHSSLCSTTARTFLGGYVALRKKSNWNGGRHHRSIGFRLMAGGTCVKYMLFDSWRRGARRFLPGIVIHQLEDSCSRGTSRKHLVMFVASDHFCTYSQHSLRRSSRSQGSLGLSARPAARSSH